MTIPIKIQRKVEKTIKKFNKTLLKKENCYYLASFDKNYLYLNRKDGRFGMPQPICRLKYTGDINNWKFEIYKYSTETFSKDIILMPGSKYIDGTIKGAMKAGMKIYPLPAFITNKFLSWPLNFLYIIVGLLGSLFGLILKIFFRIKHILSN